MFLVILLCSWHNARWGQQNAQCSRHNAWCGRHTACEVWWVEQTQSVTPPYDKKEVSFKWIFRHFYAFWEHIFLNLENGLFHTHSPTKSGNFRFIFFLNPSLSKVGNNADQRKESVTSLVCIFGVPYFKYCLLLDCRNPFNFPSTILFSTNLS